MSVPPPTPPNDDGRKCERRMRDSKHTREEASPKTSGEEHPRERKRKDNDSSARTDHLLADGESNETDALNSLAEEHAVLLGREGGLQDVTQVRHERPAHEPGTVT